MSMKTYGFSDYGIVLGDKEWEHLYTIFPECGHEQFEIAEKAGALCTGGESGK